MTIILTILKLIGMVILWILAILIIILIAMLFYPIFYEVKGEKFEKLFVEGKVKLFLGILSFKLKASKDEVTDAGLYVFGRKLGQKRKKKEKKKKQEDKDDKSLVAAEVSDSKETKNINFETTIDEDRVTIKKENLIDERKNDNWISEEEISDEPLVRRIKLSDEEKSIKDNIDTSKVPVNRIKMEQKESENVKSDVKTDDEEKVNTEKKSDQQKINLEYFLRMPKEERKIIYKAIKRLLKSTLRGIKPNNFYLTGTVGLSDPSLTGELVGVAWALNGVLNKRIEISAAFDREVIEGQVYIKGKIVPVYMAFCITRFVLVRPIRKIIKILLKGTGDKNGKRSRK